MSKEKEKKVFVPEEAPKIEPMLFVRIIVYLVAILNTGAMALFGKDLGLEANQEAIYEFVSIAFLVGTYVHGIWRNQNITKIARKRDAVAKQVIPKKGNNK